MGMPMAPATPRVVETSIAQPAEAHLSLLVVIQLHRQSDDVVPLARESAAATDESTPPDIATTIRMLIFYRRTRSSGEFSKEKRALIPVPLGNPY
jgi:hypothetical protein